MGRDRGGGGRARPNSSLFIRNIADDIVVDDLRREFARYGVRFKKRKNIRKK